MSADAADTGHRAAGAGRDTGDRHNSGVTGPDTGGDHGRTLRKLWIAIGALALLSPLGILVPMWLKGGSAWGEWGPEELKGLLGYVPAGFERLESIWTSAMPDYTLPGLRGLLGESLGYIISAVVGIAVVVGIAWLLGRALAAKERGK